jgi:hypothetical protein
MAITVDSSQWTGSQDDTPLAVPVVWGEFENEAARNNAMAQLQAAGARQGGTPAGPAGTTPEEAANQDQVSPPDEHPRQAEARNLRQNAVGMAMAGSAMAAAGIVIATGGAALPAVAAAAAAGAASGAVGEAIGAATAPTSDGNAPVEPPALDGPVIGLQAPDAETQARAEKLLRDAGARRVYVQETRAG